MIGEPDLSVITSTELANTARVITQVSTVPVIADADTGFGGPLNIARTMRCTRARASRGATSRTRRSRSGAGS